MKGEGTGTWNTYAAAEWQQAMREREKLVTDRTPMVHSSFDALGDPNAVIVRVESDQPLVKRARQVALQVVLAESLARAPEE